MKPVTTNFETCTCNRCFGSGKFSFNLINGDTCLKCMGKGYVMTKRGSAAKQYYKSLRTVTFDKLKVGDQILYDRKWRTIQSISKTQYCRDGEYLIEFKGMDCYMFDTQSFYMGIDTETNEKYLDMALKYQDTLTKTGKVRIRK